MKKGLMLYAGGTISLLLLLAGLMFLQFDEPGLPGVFAFTWMAVACLPAFSFISGIKRHEQLLMVRRSWKQEKGIKTVRKKERLFE